MDSPRILAIFVAFNEEGKIGQTLARVPRKIVQEVLLVDDASTDHTPEEGRQNGATVLTHPKRCGVGAGIRTGYDYALKHHYDITVVLAGNGKDDPAEIPRLVDPIAAGRCDLVQGSRYLPGGSLDGTPLYRRIATRYIHPPILSLLAGLRITDSTNGFRAIRTDLLRDERLDLHQPWLDHYELEPYLLIKVARLGFGVQEVAVSKTYPTKKVGYTKMKPITGWWSILKPLVLIGFGVRR